MRGARCACSPAVEDDARRTRVQTDLFPRRRSWYPPWVHLRSGAALLAALLATRCAPTDEPPGTIADRASPLLSVTPVLVEDRNPGEQQLAWLPEPGQFTQAG